MGLAALKLFNGPSTRAGVAAYPNGGQIRFARPTGGAANVLGGGLQPCWACLSVLVREEPGTMARAKDLT